MKVVNKQPTFQCTTNVAIAFNEQRAAFQHVTTMMIAMTNFAVSAVIASLLSFCEGSGLITVKAFITVEAVSTDYCHHSIIVITVD